MYSGQEAFGCSTECLHLRPAAAMHPSPQAEFLKGADGHQQSVRKPNTTSTERPGMLLWRMPKPAFRPHGSPSPELQTHETGGDKMLVVSPFLSNGDL